MITIAVIGQKGGTGKTTLTTGLAVAALKMGLAPAILDLDPQGNAWNWKKRRGMAIDPAVKSTTPAALQDDLDTLRRIGASIVFIDTPGRAESAAVRAARLADLVLIPAQMQIFDMETLKSVKDEVLGLAGDPPALVIINRAHPSAKASTMDARAMVTKVYGLPVAPFHLSNRAAYAEAPIQGLAAQEIEPDGKAAEELTALFEFVHKFIIEQVHKPTRKVANG